MLELAYAYFLALQGRECSRRVILNDAIVADRPGVVGEAFVDLVNLDDWILPGPNHLELRTSPIGGASRLRGLLAVKPTPSVVETIEAFDDAPTLQTFDFHVGPPLDGAVESAPALAPHDMQAIRHQVMALHAAIRQRQIDTAMEMLQLRTSHLAQRFGLSTSEATARLRAQLESFRSPQVELAHIDESKIDLVLRPPEGERLPGAPGCADRRHGAPQTPLECPSGQAFAE